jgi:hypothetical protein
MKAVLEGDKLMKEVLNGGYNVHPVPPPREYENGYRRLSVKFLLVSSSYNVVHRSNVKKR